MLTSTPCAECTNVVMGVAWECLLAIVPGTHLLSEMGTYHLLHPLSGEEMRTTALCVSHLQASESSLSHPEHFASHLSSSPYKEFLIYGTRF